MWSNLDAVASAVNRPPMLDKVFLGQNVPLYSMVPMGMWSHIDAFKQAFGDGNIAKARELLKSRGYTEANKFTFHLWYTPSHYGDTEADLAAVLKDQLRPRVWWRLMSSLPNGPRMSGSKGMGINFSDPVWDKKLTEGQIVTDWEKRIAIYQEIQKMWTEQVPALPIWQGILYLFAQIAIRGIMLSPTLHFNYAAIYGIK
jgi:peptide/nickel transport system substrate-binding protein